MTQVRCLPSCTVTYRERVVILPDTKGHCALPQSWYQ